MHDPDEASLRAVAEATYFGALENGASPEDALDQQNLAVEQYVQDCNENP